MSSANAAFTPESWQAIGLTLQLASVTTTLLLLLATPLAWWLASTSSRWRGVVGALVALPLVLPPTVIGFYLLLVMSPESPLGSWLDNTFGLILPFSFTGLVIGSVIYSLPFVIQPVRNAFVAIGPEPLETAATLRANPVDAFFTVALPLARPGILTAAVLGFAHTLGEFGVVLLIGGNIPGETRVVSIAIYDQVETLEWANAHWLSGMMLLISFLLLLVMQRLQRRSQGML